MLDDRTRLPTNPHPCISRDVFGDRCEPQNPTNKSLDSGLSEQAEAVPGGRPALSVDRPALTQHSSPQRPGGVPNPLASAHSKRPLPAGRGPSDPLLFVSGTGFEPVASGLWAGSKPVPTIPPEFKRAPDLARYLSTVRRRTTCGLAPDGFACVLARAEDSSGATVRLSRSLSWPIRGVRRLAHPPGVHRRVDAVPSG
jgi:hypothetical protein